jgi:hypothetical protein
MRLGDDPSDDEEVGPGNEQGRSENPTPRWSDGDIQQTPRQPIASREARQGGRHPQQEPRPVRTQGCPCADARSSQPDVEKREAAVGERHPRQAPFRACHLPHREVKHGHQDAEAAQREVKSRVSAQGALSRRQTLLEARNEVPKVKGKGAAPRSSASKPLGLGENLYTWPLSQRAFMTMTRLSLFYAVSYLVPSGVLLLVHPRIVFELLLSTQPDVYGDVVSRMAGAVILALGLIVAQIIRLRAETLYSTLVGVRVLLVACWIWLYLRTQDRFFLLLAIVVGFGMSMTAAGLVVDRKRAQVAQAPAP